MGFFCFVFLFFKILKQKLISLQQVGKMSPITSFLSHTLSAPFTCEGRSGQRAGCCQQLGWELALPSPHSQGLTLQTKRAGEISPVIAGNSKHPSIFFSPASLQTDKAVARAPNLRGLGKPFLKHTFVTDSDMTAIHCWLIITRKKEKKKNNNH